MEINNHIKKLEREIGFEIKRPIITLKNKQPHDETFSYNLAINFYEKEEHLKSVIIAANKILEQLLLDKEDIKKILLFYSLIGDMYYVLGKFKISAGYFMKTLSSNKEDLTSWIGLLFSLRALGKFELFERGIFDFDKIYYEWKNSSEKEMTQEYAEKVLLN
jgi:tetratricopeptide (TPR) repeat protein